MVASAGWCSERLVVKREWQVVMPKRLACAKRMSQVA